MTEFEEIKEFVKQVASDLLKGGRGHKVPHQSEFFRAMLMKVAREGKKRGYKGYINYPIFLGPSESEKDLKAGMALGGACWTQPGTNRIVYAFECDGAARMPVLKRLLAVSPEKERIWIHGGKRNLKEFLVKKDSLSLIKVVKISAPTSRGTLTAPLEPEIPFEEIPEED